MNDLDLTERIIPVWAAAKVRAEAATQQAKTILQQAMVLRGRRRSSDRNRSRKLSLYRTESESFSQVTRHDV